MRKDFTKFLIESLCKYYKYNVFEYNSSSGKLLWGLEKADEPTSPKLIFCNKEDYENINSQYIKVILTNEDLNTNSYTSDNIIIVDISKGNLTHLSPNAEQQGNEILSLLNWMKENKVFEKKAVPVITYSLILINILVFLVSALLSGNIFSINQDVLIAMGAKYNPGIYNGEYYRLITCAFLHGGVVHIALNMYSLYCVGPMIEEVYNKTKFTIIYFVSAILASLFSLYFSDAVSIGASGAIFGLLGAALIFGIKMRNRINKNFLFNIISVIAINIFIGASLPNIDSFAHIGGLIGGIVTTSLYKIQD